MDRVVEIEKFESEISYETTLRPNSWEEYIGQTKIKKNLKVFIEASKKEKRHLTIFYFLDHLV